MSLAKENCRSYNCSLVTSGQSCIPKAPLSKFQFQPGKIHRLRLINAGAEGIQRFSIDEHDLTIIANDFVPVAPYPSRVVTLAVGQRTDVLVQAKDQLDGAFWMRSNISTLCSIPNQPHGLAVVYYPQTDDSIVPNSTATPFVEADCGNVRIYFLCCY